MGKFKGKKSRSLEMKKTSLLFALGCLIQFCYNKHYIIETFDDGKFKPPQSPPAPVPEEVGTDYAEAGSDYGEGPHKYGVEPKGYGRPKKYGTTTTTWTTTWSTTTPTKWTSKWTTTPKPYRLKRR